MNLKKLERANKIMLSIKQLDAEIIEIEKHAMLIANGEVEIGLTLSTIDLVKKEENDAKTRFDEDGSLINPTDASDLYKSMRSMWLGYMPTTIAIKKDTNNEHIYTSKIKENAALQILGVLLFVKQSERELKLKQLQKMGVDI